MAPSLAKAVEVIAGILVAIKPRMGAYVVCSWLLGIVINLLMVVEVLAEGGPRKELCCFLFPNREPKKDGGRRATNP